MILYTVKTSSRLQYIVHFIECIIGQAIIATTDATQFLQSIDIKINYSDDSICADEYLIKPHGLLFENTVRNIPVEVSACRNNPCFFFNENDNHGFDVLAAIFYLISRYEEYLPYQKDSYGRYAHTNSLAYKSDFLHLPLVNFWLKDLMERLPIVNCQLSTENTSLITPNPQLQTNKFTFTPTYDIDIAYAHQYQSIFKNVGGFFKDLMRGNLEKIIERANVYSGKTKDPFDVYDWLDDLHKRYQLQPIYFFLLAEKRGMYDKNISPKSNGMKRLIKQHYLKYTIGIHPSWQSGDNKIVVKNEIKQLENITQANCTISRQHYIRFTLPETYRHLINERITKDYSMGYGSINGFRASVASPFFWYDLAAEKQTSLLIYSFCYMDANSYFKQQLSADAAELELQQYYDVVQQVGGQCIAILHNNFLTEQPQWLAWRNMYAAFLDKNFG